MNHRFPQGHWGGSEGQWNCCMKLTFPHLLISLGMPATEELRTLRACHLREDSAGREHEEKERIRPLRVSLMMHQSIFSPKLHP